METEIVNTQQNPALTAGETEERNSTWGENHRIILSFVQKHMQSEKAMPTVTAIARETGLTRATVYKHLQGINGHPALKEHNNMFKLMASDVLRKMCSEAIYGNVKAARLFLEVMGLLKNNKTINNNFITDNTNYVQINGIVLNDELVDGLSLEQLTEIEKIIMKGKE